MRMPEMGVRAAGAAVIFFGLVHLCLNAYIMAARFLVDPDKLRGFMAALAGVFGPIAIPEDMGIAVSLIKILASLSFLAAGAGMMALKAWSRKFLVALLVLRLVYGIVICAHFKMFHPHLGIIFLEFILLTYYLTRPAIRAVFVK